MDGTKAFPLRSELIEVLDLQIEMLTRKSFASFTADEMCTFKSREQKIRELQAALAATPGDPVSYTGVFAPLYT
jgi:hypothetical protein